LIFVVFGPGGAGKGTVVKALLERVPGLWLSRSWTTRARRVGEAEDAYVFVDRDTFESHAAAGGFLEWVTFLDYLQGTPLPDPPPGHDIVLEIDLQGALQIKEQFPAAVLILLAPPSREAQETRLRGRGDPAERVSERLALAEKEESEGRDIADHVVVNDDLNRAVEELAGIVGRYRTSPGDADG
jgi:guanylate kinase